MKMKNQRQKIPIFDLNLAAFQHLHGNTPELELQGTRVIFLFNPNDMFYKISGIYNSNTSVNVLDFVNSQRQLRAMMLSMRGSAK
jgi:hypothetical protein